ncbi:MAG: cell division protein FtsQ/DivIB [Aquisalimonadaceae bacterium]
MRAVRKRNGAITPRQRRPVPVAPTVRAARREGLQRIVRTSGVVLLLVAAVGGAGYGVYHLTSPQTFPLQAVRFDSELTRVREQDLRGALDSHLHGGFWRLDVDRIRQVLEDLAWVDTATVRRVWPGVLRITIREQEAVAVWNDESLLNARGDLFTPPRVTWPQGLPMLSGQPRRSGTVSRRLRELRPAFAELGYEVEALALDARESWTVTLEGGATIALGREGVDARIRRFTSAYESLPRQAGGVLASADLRYPNGFAIRWTSASGDTK